MGYFLGLAVAPSMPRHLCRPLGSFALNFKALNLICVYKMYIFGIEGLGFSGLSRTYPSVAVDFGTCGLVKVSSEPVKRGIESSFAVTALSGG